MGTGFGIPGEYYPSVPTIVRGGGPLTDKWALCNAHNAAGNIDISKAGAATLWIDASFGDGPADELLVKPVFSTHPEALNNLPAQVSDSSEHYGANLFLTDLAVVFPTTNPVVTSATGGFAEWMEGMYLHLVTAVNGTPGCYLIESVDNSHQVTLATPCGPGGDLSDGIGRIVSEYQQAVGNELNGVCSLQPFVLRLLPTDFPTIANPQDGVAIPHTLNLPAASTLRLYVKGTGTLTRTSLVLCVTLEPLGAS